jgi:uncharacterized protein (TIGR00251 family)
MSREGLAVSELELAAVAGGTRIRLRVKPGAKKNGVLGVHDGALRVAVTAAPEKGKANRAALAVLAAVLDLAPSTLEILSGHASPNKSVRAPLPPAELRARLARPTGG